MPSVSASAHDQALYQQLTKENGGKENVSRNKLAKDLNTFLTLLTSQLKHQDPLSPMDSTEFTQQLVQFAQVEQQMSQNEKLDKLVAAQNASLAATAVSYIGNYVEAESNQVPLQDGKGRFAYGLREAAKQVGILVKDATGRVVRSFNGETSAGMHDFRWDGKDDNGDQLPDGTYNLAITATSDKGSVETWSTAFGKVTGVTSKDGEVLLVMDKAGVPISKILSISATWDGKNASLDSALGYVGKSVEVRSNMLTLQNGKARLGYTLPSMADNTTISIVDSDGFVVRTLDGRTGSGNHTLEWDGTNDEGVLLEDGPYSVRVTAKQGETLLENIATTTFGTVTAVSNAGGTPMVVMGTSTIPVSAILAAAGV
ncbi:hypothetical protein HEQ72_00645 [Haematospirillum sp. 15-248]|uniref:FlgD immunoglobulin-like domain containing protein n=1 Tax=Haematospirillum sp. 15-248 TaxID=2723107 RepID=UPI00143B5258|nr:FlgD immunoglobulin-like domain containing protein [Haematospirillum sp. 15-248]NKD86827.1 hypothetical protein [Haematospirillum sp. 15-248]